jgi:spermidine/putrescine transport system permease protein
MRKKNSPFSIVYLTLVLIFMYIPIVIVITYSFNKSGDTSTWSGFSLNWYKTLFQNDDILTALKNSLVLAGLSCLVSAVIGTIGAVGMVSADFKTKGLLEGISAIPIMIPEIIFGMAFLSFFTFANIPFGMLTLVISHTTFCIPYVFIIVKSRLVMLDKSVGEAARDLGAGPIRAFFDITLPLIAPAIISGTMLAFAMSLDDVVISFFTNGPETNTLPIKIYSEMKVGVTPEINALCTLMLGITFLAIALSTLLKNINKKNRGVKQNEQESQKGNGTSFINSTDIDIV